MYTFVSTKIKKIFLWKSSKTASKTLIWKTFIEYPSDILIPYSNLMWSSICIMNITYFVNSSLILQKITEVEILEELKEIV